MPHLIGRSVPFTLVGDELTVFVYQGSDGERLATTRIPRHELGQVRFLKATMRMAVGPFFDWGLGTEALVPYAEQTADVVVGGRYPIGLIVGRDGRLVGTMCVSDLLAEPRGASAPNQWVDDEA